MKHIRIVFALLLVVGIAMVGIFFVEGVTSPIIDERLANQANISLFEMFGVDVDNPGNFTLSEVPAEEDSAVTNVYIMKDGSTEVGVIYKAEIAGFNPGIIFLIGIATEDNTVQGFSILVNGETAGIGKDLLEDPLFSEQFIGMTVEETRDDGVDFVSGSTAKSTLGGINRGLETVLVYHGVNFLGQAAPIIETPEMLLERLMTEWFVGDTLTNVSADYDLGNTVTEIYEAKAGNYLIKAVFNGIDVVFDYPEKGTIILLEIENETIVNFATISTNETIGFGYDVIMDDDFPLSVVGMDINNTGIDSVAGVTITISGFNAALNDIAVFYGVNFQGMEAPVEETPEMIVTRLKTEFFSGTYTDVTSNYPDNNSVLEVLESSTGGYVITGIFKGFASDSLYMIGIDGNTVVGYGTVSTNETVGIGADLVLHPDFAAQFAGLDINALSDDGVDMVAGSTASITLDGLNKSVKEVINFYNTEISGVLDTEAPVITINEAKAITFSVDATAPSWASYATATDNQTVSSLTNDAAEVVDLGTVGTYDVTFTAIDNSGNVTTKVVTITVQAGEVAFVIVPVNENILIVLEGMDSESVAFSDEALFLDPIEGAYTGRDADMNVTSVFYFVKSDNNNYGTGNDLNYTMIQMDPVTNTVIKIVVFVANSTYTSDYATNKGTEIDAAEIAALWEGVGGLGSVDTADMDSASGTTADYTFPRFIEAIESAIAHQILYQIGGAQ